LIAPMRAYSTTPDVELDLGRYELRKHGRPVRLERKPMELLIFLVARRDQLVTRQEIVTKLWRSDLFVDTEQNINNIVRKIRAALGDDSTKPRFLETVVGKGYRFIGPVGVIDARHPQSESQSEYSDKLSAGHSARSERPALAVLPLITVGTVTDDQGICLGFADALVSRLGALQGVDVLPTSATINASRELSITQTCAQFGVRFVVHGAIQESKGQWRLSLELFDSQQQSAILRRKYDLDVARLPELEDEIAKTIAGSLNRPLRSGVLERRPRYSRDPFAYAEFVRGFELSSSGDSALLEESARRLANAVTRDPDFALAHATLSFVCAVRHFEFDPSSTWLERAEFHCRRALEADPGLPEAHVSNAFLLWGPSKNFQHVAAIDELRRALALQKNLPHAYNRLGTILAHIGLLDRAGEMYRRGAVFHPRKAVSHSILQVFVWNGEYDSAREEIEAWRADNPGNKYPIYFDAQLALMTGDLSRALSLLEEAEKLVPDEPLIVSLLGVYHALAGNPDQALGSMNRALANPKSFGHAHHTYYQSACILAILNRPLEAFAWLERSVSTGFACWPFFLNDPCLRNVQPLPEFQVLVSALQSKYPDHLGIL
jgi:DNA-binding winged helix-turn-helix (wHTH) protein/tetratricopeptide (TPR) repeat protein